MFYSRFIEGKWVAASGLIYPFAAALLCDAPPEGAERYAVSIDYGTVNPTSMGLWALNGGVWYRIDEYYYDARQAGQRRTDEEHFRGFLRLTEGRTPETVVCDPSAASFIELLRSRGYAVTPAKNDVRDGDGAQKREDPPVRLLRRHRARAFAVPLGGRRRARRAGEGKRPRYG